MPAERAVAMLPLYLAGVRRMVILAGPSYLSRLWCVMEVFIFMRIKDVSAGSALISQFFTVKLLGDSTDLVLSLARFDAAKAQCRYDRDRQKLLAVIEASFGTTAPFDELVVKVFNEQVIGVKGFRALRGSSVSV